MLKVAPTPRPAAQQQPGTALRKPASSRPPPASSSRVVQAPSSSATPSEQRKPSLKAPSSSATTLSAKRAVGTPAGTARALPSTSIGTARKASGSSAPGGAGGSEALEGRRARRVSATGEKQTVGSSARGALSRSTHTAVSTSRLPPSAAPATASNRAVPTTTPTKRRVASDSSSKADGSSNTAISETPRARRAAAAASAVDSATTPRAVRSKRSLGASDAPPPAASTTSKKTSTLSSIGKGVPTRPPAPPSAAPSTRKASRPSLTSSTSRPLRTPLKSTNAPPPPSTLNMNTSARAPPLKRSSSIPIAASGSVRMGKTSSAISSQSIEEDKAQTDGIRSESAASSVGRMEPARAPSSASTRAPNANRSPTRLPTKKAEATRPRSPIRAPSHSEDRPPPPPVVNLVISQSERRDSWETLPPSARPSLSGGAPPPSRLDASQGPSISLSQPVGDSYPSAETFEGDVSWETIESRRASAINPATFSLDSFHTPQKPASSADFTSTVPFPLADTDATAPSGLPTRANMSYNSPDASTLRNALSNHQLSLVHSSTSPSSTPQNPHARALNSRLASLSPPELLNQNRGRESSSIEELLKMSLLSAKRAGGDGGDEEWLYEEGTSRVMKADLDGVGTPWRRSVAVREDETDGELWREEAEEARERIELLERELRLRSVQALEDKARVEEDRQAWRMEMEHFTELKLRMEGEAEAVAAAHHEERRRWEQEFEAARSTAASDPIKEDQLELELALHQAAASHFQLITLADGLSARAEAEREECSGVLASLRLIAAGLQVWEEAVSE